MVATNLITDKNREILPAAKLKDLRELMASYDLDCYLIPAVDEHLNLSVPAAKQRRAWISGFTGSAGDLLVGKDAAWLFVDSRYYEQAELQVDAALIQISKLGLEGNLSLIETLEKIAVESAQKSTKIRFGFDPFTVATEQYQNWVKKFATAGIELVAISENLADKVRQTTEFLPAIDESPIFSLPVSLTGETAAQKLVRVREVMQTANIDVLPISNLNQIAWLFNLRGSDIPHIPIFISYAIVTADAAFLFTNLDRVSPEIKKELSAAVTLLPYADYPSILESCVNLVNKVRVLLDSKHSTAGTYKLILGQQKAENKIEIVFAPNPVEGMKARKNPVEIEQMKSANFKASRAKVLTLMWLTKQLESGKVLTEFDVKESIESFYQQETDFQTLTFRTIAGAGANSSIVHYGTPSPEITLKPGELLLLDSGAQYLAGTTDDTRTMIVGEPTALQIEHYTTVLIAHINCALQQFPKGTTGSQLDAIARAVLWQQQLDYGHGTGHGVGAFLAGHEGPNGISKFVQYPLEAGMVTSIEPGYYEPGWGGIRLENLYVVREMPSKNATVWYGFEPLTYIPFERKLIDVDRLSKTQLQWLNNYHASVIEKLSPVLDAATIAWLKKACAALGKIQ
ncbi:aminopeptidase P family protein [Tychonema sp. LEGE 07199]|uniref:aminopeptidase P family protein n=1 Tax=unclassified Tychonema TaxID=2642144 RepID=UPI001882DC41|nr:MULTISPECIES: aminopeptidase P family protein [unclassified Tychonema]MBE9123269.1 aminopeptidase P family protein [Tychonema sp. LEGE 07199]MBE9134824.1 aminopeptidase P family protein [Tychonema sp. LEGE 07196]